MNFVDFHLIGQGLGPLRYPLLVCSIIAMALMLERLCVLVYYTVTKRLHLTGMQFIHNHIGTPKALREDAASIWLEAQSEKLTTGLKGLTLIATLAPLLGLLGTVLGLIRVFDDLGQHQGAIDPSILAEGLGIAMKTTATGLIIAIPCFACAHLFQLWAEKLVQYIQHAMNIENLHLEGMSTANLQ